MTDLLQNTDLLKYISIPFIAGLIGWFTNWLAIKLTFYPLEFVGVRPFFGWQGIIPSKARKMATVSVDATLSKISTVREIFDEIDPNVLSKHILETVTPRIQEYVDELMVKEHPTLWENLPVLVRQQIYKRVQSNAPALLDNLLEDVADNIEDLFDIKQVVADQLVNDKRLLNRIFLECGHHEFKFIVNSGAWMGFTFGLIQMCVWYFFQSGWVLPVAGFIVGFATNWVALNIIFRPLNPVKISRYKLHGLFLQRQKEVAASFCSIITHEILTIENIINAILNGRNAERTQNMVKKNIKPIVDEAAGVARPLTLLAMGPRRIANLKQSVAEKAIDITPSTFHDPAFNAERAAVVESIMRVKMEALTSEEFQDLLRPCFQEDEIKLILVGAVLGFSAGLAQLIFVFGLPI
ncbi:DUF445 domain-containing protein [Alkalimarinus sediminis]|uniref:DUF445 domain-containing protein n=1 Tax=Alkalimarinus sediminis TaxID=1632866 RepID=A0A9E8HS68_9ALTE|nr:DUF445 domain-containing protein [Alkalimarinus sediminis]UZW75536.1 DUF445 domain-containing protein [Alkalimarinus sediminis]